jgi:hypothetical protein
MLFVLGIFVCVFHNMSGDSSRVSGDPPQVLWRLCSVSLQKEHAQTSCERSGPTLRHEEARPTITGPNTMTRGLVAHLRW